MRTRDVRIDHGERFADSRRKARLQNCTQSVFSCFADGDLQSPALAWRRRPVAAICYFNERYGDSVIGALTGLSFGIRFAREEEGIDGDRRSVMIVATKCARRNPRCLRKLALPELRPSILDPCLDIEPSLDQCLCGERLVLAVNKRPVAVIAGGSLDCFALNARLHQLRHRRPRTSAA